MLSNVYRFYFIEYLLFHTISLHCPRFRYGLEFNRILTTMKSYLLLFVGLLCLFSCKQNDEILGTCSTPPVLIPSALDYIPLKIGNYWIYDWLSSNGTDSLELFFPNDTLKVAGLEMIKGQEYFRMERNSGAIEDTLVYWRDSLGYLVNEVGRVIFTAEESNRVFDRRVFGNPLSPFLTIEYALDGEALEAVEAPAGVFYCLKKEGKFSFGNPNNQQVKSDYDFIGPEVGIVKGIRNFANNPSFFQFELIEYHLE